MQFRTCSGLPLELAGRGLAIFLRSVEHLSPARSLELHTITPGQSSPHDPHDPYDPVSGAVCSRGQRMVIGVYRKGPEGSSSSSRDRTGRAVWAEAGAEDA